MKCAGLKEWCEWLEVGGPGPVVDSGKGKAKKKEVDITARRREAQEEEDGGEGC